MALDERKRLLEKLRKANLPAVDEARRSLDWIEAALNGIELQSPFQATITFCAPVKVATIRTDVKNYADIQQHERWLREAVQRRPRGGLRGVLWHRCADSGLLEGEPLVEVHRAPVRAGTR